MADNTKSNLCAYAVRTESLAAVEPNDLSDKDREELSQHLASCRQCAMRYAELRNEYSSMDALIRSFPADESLPRLTLPQLRPRNHTNSALAEDEESRLLPAHHPLRKVDDIKFSDLDIGNQHLPNIRRLGSMVGRILAFVAILILMLFVALAYTSYSNKQGSPNITTIYTPNPTPISHDRMISTNLQFRCVSCDEPKVTVTLTQYLIQGDISHIVLYFRVTNNTAESIGVTFSTIQIREPDGRIVKAIGNNDPVLFVEARASENTTIAFDFGATPNATYKLDLELRKAGVWVNLYQSEMITFISRK